jgi:hypothetical protein
MIGKVELERANENTSSHVFERRGSYSSQRVIEPLVLSSEIRMHSSLEGEVVRGGKVVKARFIAAAVRTCSGLYRADHSADTGRSSLCGGSAATDRGRTRRFPDSQRRDRHTARDDTGAIVQCLIFQSH